MASQLEQLQRPTRRPRVFGNNGGSATYLDQSWWQFDAPAGTLIRQLGFDYRA